MKKKMISRILTIALAGAMVFASASAVFGANKPMDNGSAANEKSGSTKVEGIVETASPGDPSYVITIPEKIDFGTLRQPATDTDSFKDIPFVVTASEFSNIPQGSAVAVLVRDAKDAQTNNEWSGKFAIEKDGNELVYTVLNQSGTDLSTLKLDYANGILFNAFAAEGDANGTARLNQKQLYGKDLNGADSSWVGTYEGTMNFYAKVVSMADYH